MGLRSWWCGGCGRDGSVVAVTITGPRTSELRVSNGILDLSNRDLDRVPDWVAAVRSPRAVMVLKLQGNRLQSLSHINQFKSLLRINVSYNELGGFPELIGDLIDLVRLTDLVAHHNQIGSIQADIARLIKLEVMDFSWNALTEVDSAISLLHQLRNLNLSNNKLVSICNLQELPKLEQIDLSFNVLRSLPSDFLSGCMAVTRVVLAHNDLVAIPDGICRLTSVQILDLGYNALSTVPGRIGEMRLVQLDLIRNRIACLPARQLARMTTLRHLDLRHNLIYLPTQFRDVTDAATVFAYLVEQDECHRRTASGSTVVRRHSISDFTAEDDEDVTRSGGGGGDLPDLINKDDHIPDQIDSSDDGSDLDLSSLSSTRSQPLQRNFSFEQKIRFVKKGNRSAHLQAVLEHDLVSVTPGPGDHHRPGSRAWQESPI